MLVHCRDFHRLRFQCRDHVRRFDPAGFDFGRIKLLHSVDKSAIPLLRRIEVWTKAPINKDVDDISKADEQFKIKSLNEQWQRKEVQAPRNDAATGRQQLHDTVQAAAMNLCRMESTKSVSTVP